MLYREYLGQVRRVDDGVGRISTVLIPIKLSGSLLRQTDDEDTDDDDDDDDVEKMYETDSDFYSSVSGEIRFCLRPSVRLRWV